MGSRAASRRRTYYAGMVGGGIGTFLPTRIVLKGVYGWPYGVTMIFGPWLWLASGIVVGMGAGLLAGMLMNDHGDRLSEIGNGRLGGWVLAFLPLTSVVSLIEARLWFFDFDSLTPAILLVLVPVLSSLFTLRLEKQRDS